MTSVGTCTQSNDAGVTKTVIQCPGNHHKAHRMFHPLNSIFINYSKSVHCILKPNTKPSRIDSYTNVLFATNKLHRRTVEAELCDSALKSCYTAQTFMGTRARCSRSHRTFNCVKTLDKEWWTHSARSKWPHSARGVWRSPDLQEESSWCRPSLVQFYRLSSPLPFCPTSFCTTDSLFKWNLDLAEWK